jgi:PAS domain S-box-containing protein
LSAADRLPPPASWTTYAVAVVSVGLALGLNIALAPLIQADTFPAFFAAVMVSTWYAGRRTGLLATMLGVLANGYLFLSPGSFVGVSRTSHIVQQTLFLLGGLLIVGLGSRLRAAQQRAEEREHAATLQEELMRAGEAKFRGLLDSAPDGIVIVDGQGFIVLVNSQAQRMFGFTTEELLGQPVEILLPEAARGRHAAHREAYGANPTTRPMGMGIELSGRRKDGSEFPVEISLSPLRTKDGLLITSDIRDISERKRVEAQVGALNENLARRVTELAAVNRELEAFSYSVSHDLRAPLRSIDGFSQALLEEYGDRLDTTGEDYLRRVRSAARRMGELIDDLLDLSRVTRREMRHELVDLSALARAVMAELQKSDPARPVKVVIADGLVAAGDAQLLRLVLENLLGNAWKFTSKQPAPRIELGAFDRDGHRVFFVRDNGVGFDMAYAHKLFGAFQRLHGMTEFPGTGIGLATVQRIIHRHGGEVWAEAEVGRGATFSFTL